MRQRHCYCRPGCSRQPHSESQACRMHEPDGAIAHDIEDVLTKADAVGARRYGGYYNSCGRGRSHRECGRNQAAVAPRQGTLAEALQLRIHVAL